MHQVLAASFLVVLLGLTHIAPLVAKFFLGGRLGAPVDGGRTWRDGRPLLGPHKTWRGVVVALAAGAVGGLALPLVADGMSLFEGALAGAATGALGMLGDMGTSFAKRRLGLRSGRDVPLLDHLLEGLLPALFIAPRLGLGPGGTAAALAGFCALAYALTLLYKSGVGMLRAAPSRRLGPSSSLRSRLREYASCRATGLAGAFLSLRDILVYRVLVTAAFGAVGLLKVGRENALGVRAHELSLCFDDLPAEFDGYRILFAADLHLDGLDGLAERLAALFAAESPDLVLLGGDYRFATFGPADEAMRRLALVLDGARPSDGSLAVLGNHDCESMIEPLRAMGVRTLLNETAEISRGGARIWIVGIDDPHDYEGAAAAATCPLGDGFRLVLAHTPEAYAEAAACGARLYLCGHTHAGQVSLPWIGPLVTLARSPRRLARGLWREGRMLGYTTSGAGVSGSPLRFGTRGEVVRVILRRWARGAPSACEDA